MDDVIIKSIRGCKYNLFSGFNETIKYKIEYVNKNDLNDMKDLSIITSDSEIEFFHFALDFNSNDDLSLLQLYDGKYTYVNRDGNLLEYRFDIATEFNEYGLAIVGINGKLTWINKDFEYLTIFGEKEKIDINDFTLVDGFDKLSNFNNDSIAPLFEKNGFLYYVNIEMKIKRSPLTNKPIQQINPVDILKQELFRSLSTECLTLIGEDINKIGKDILYCTDINIKKSQIRTIDFSNIAGRSMWVLVYQTIFKLYPECNLGFKIDDNDSMILFIISDSLIVIMRRNNFNYKFFDKICSRYRINEKKLLKDEKHLIKKL